MFFGNDMEEYFYEHSKDSVEELKKEVKTLDIPDEVADREDVKKLLVLTFLYAKRTERDKDKAKHYDA